MSYSFKEVLPYLVRKESGILNFNYDFFNEIIQDKEELKKLEEVSHNLISAQGNFYSIFNIPAFTMGDKIFEAKTFNITVNHIDDRILDGCYEGKNFYHYSSYLTDSDSNQRMILISHYYDVNDCDLTDIEIFFPQYEVEENEIKSHEKLSYSFVLLKGEKSDFEIFGVFSSLNTATESVSKLKKDGFIKKPTELHIEKIICESILLPNKAKSINVLKNCIEAYDSKGTLLYKLS